MNIFSDKTSDLELKLQNLNEKINMVDEYSRHMTNYTLTILSIVIAIASVTIILAVVLSTKHLINQKVEKEIGKRVIKVLSGKRPIFFASGISKPDSNGYIQIPTDLDGYAELSHETLMFIDSNQKGSQSWGQMETGLISKFQINDEGQKVISVINYDDKNGEIEWNITWVRKNYS